MQIKQIEAMRRTERWLRPFVNLPISTISISLTPDPAPKGRGESNTEKKATGGSLPPVAVFSVDYAIRRQVCC